MTNFTKEQILQHYKNAIGRLNSRKVKSSEMNQDDWFIATTNITKFMPTNRSLSDRLFALDLDLTTNPQCKVCGVNTNYVRAEVGKPRGFRVYCSQLCASKDKKGVSIIRDEVKAAQKRKDTMIEKYGYEFNSQRPEVKEVLGQHNKCPEFKLRQSKIQKDKYPSINYNLIDTPEKLKILNYKYSVVEMSNLVNCSTSVIHQSFWKHGVDIKQHVSGLERKVRMLLDSHNIEYKTNDRTILNGKEIDIYIASKKLGIECNGLYWHSEKKLSKRFHIEKTIECEKQDITLLHFFEHEILKKFDLVEDMILSKMNMNKKIYARKCKIMDVDVNNARNFFNKNHLQGHVNAKFYSGLYYNDELVSVMSMSSPRFKNTKYPVDLEIVRFASLNGYTVIGGFSKLLNLYKNYNIVSYANRRWSKGDVYEKNGFKHVYNTNVGFFYTKGLNVKSRYSDLRPLEEVINDGWCRVFDCGNRVYIKYKIGDIK